MSEISDLKISVIGLGFVGHAIYQVLAKIGFIENVTLFGYDKYKQIGTGKIDRCLDTDIMFLALPTQFNEITGQYDKEAIYETCDYLSNRYHGVLLLKSTVEPGTTQKLAERYTDLKFIHNPEFLTARTAVKDFEDQKQVMLGTTENIEERDIEKVVNFYHFYFPNAIISKCTSLESESAKIFCNCFYATKVQFFTELYLLCQKNGSDYNKIKDLMIKNGWINPMHTMVPGVDGLISYGGMCFPKDTNALLKYMISNETPHGVLESVIEERNEMREDHINVIRNTQNTDK